jgi:hypothetical protein
MTISLGATVPASATTVSGTYGDVVIQSNGFLVTSDTTGTGYGGLYFQYSTPILLNSITQLSADYQMTMGTFGGGAPRFTLFDSGGNSAYIYFGTPLGGQGFADPNLGAFQNTGNYAASTEPSCLCQRLRRAKHLKYRRDVSAVRDGSWLRRSQFRISRFRWWIHRHPAGSA